MPLLLAFVGHRDDLAIKEVVLSAGVQGLVQDAFREQESSFRDGTEVPFNENWRLDPDEIAVTEAAPFNIFLRLSQLTDTTVEPIGDDELDDVRGLAMTVGNDRQVTLVQAFSLSMLLTRGGWLSLIQEEGTYTRLDRSGFRLADKIVCLVEGGLLKFRSLHAMSRLLDTSTMFMEATNSDIERFTNDNEALFYVNDIDEFLASTTRTARKHIGSIMSADVLSGHTALSLQEAMRDTGLTVSVRNGRIEMPRRSTDIAELMRFLNDGRYVGPVSGTAYITNSRRPAP